MQTPTQIQKPTPIIPTTKTTNILQKSISNSNSFHLRSPSLNSLRLRRIFDLFDTNHDSFITVDELTRALSLLGLDTNTSDLETIIKSYVQPGNTGLMYDEFVKLHRSINDMFFGCDDVVELIGSKEEQEEADLTEAFKVFDENGDGFISANELQMVLGKLGFSEANEMARVKMMISSVDLNHDGRVDFSEFKDMMRVLQ
uniref:calcium-binding protein CAST-like n=1 Tax=Erigeron canadensis TaxID=72917 RepID=UPI001CB8B385|nr:calcium-binding protein CAST-like [Erigeron canadensis]